jgi:hypothetical protein
VRRCQRRLERPGEWTVGLYQFVWLTGLAPLFQPNFEVRQWSSRDGCGHHHWCTKRIFEDAGNTSIYDHVLEFLLKDTAREGWDWNANSQFKRRPHAPIWDSELGHIIVARLVFGFVTRRIWFTRAEVKHSFSKHHGISQLSARSLLVLRHGPSTRFQGVSIVALSGQPQAAGNGWGAGGPSHLQQACHAQGHVPEVQIHQSAEAVCIVRGDLLNSRD